jgi:hypothetical protein
VADLMEPEADVGVHVAGENNVAEVRAILVRLLYER